MANHKCIKFMMCEVRSHLPEVGDEEGRVDDAERGQLDGGPVEVAQVREERFRACA